MLTPLTSLRQTIQNVDSERLTTLNIDDLETWKSPQAGPEEFCFRGPRGLLFSLRIQYPTNDPEGRERSRFLSIQEAIARYSREGGRLVNSTLPEPATAPPQADIVLEDPALAFPGTKAEITSDAL